MSTTSSIDSKSLCYSEKLLSLDVGHTISFAGRTLPNAECFDFFLGSDRDTEDDLGDIILHTKVNFSGSSDIVSRSHTRNFGWDESRESQQKVFSNNLLNPIKRGSDFRMSIYVDSGFFLISINGKPFCVFPYQKALRDFHQLRISGDIETIYEVVHTRESLEKNAKAFKSTLPSLEADLALVLTGTPRVSEDGQFGIKLFTKHSGRELLDINVNVQAKELRINEQLTYHEPFPFLLNEMFKLAIGVTETEFVVAIDGEHVITAGHTSQNFLGKPFDLELSLSDPGAVQVHSVDAFAEGSTSPFASQPEIDVNVDQPVEKRLISMEEEFSQILQN